MGNLIVVTFRVTATTTATVVSDAICAGTTTRRVKWISVTNESTSIAARAALTSDATAFASAYATIPSSPSGILTYTFGSAEGEGHFVPISTRALYVQSASSTAALVVQYAYEPLQGD